MPRKTDTVYQEPITAALLKSRKHSDVGLSFPYGDSGWTVTSDDSVDTTTTPPVRYKSGFLANKQTGNPNVDAIANVIRSEVGNIDVFLRSQGEKPEEYTQEQLQELNGQLDNAVLDCARGFAEEGWSADDVKKYADKAWRADLGTTFFQKTFSNAVAYLPMSSAMLGVSFLLTPILGPLPTMLVGLGVGLYTAYKWSVHALNAAGKVDAEVNDEKQGRGRFWSVCPSKGLWQAIGKETLADLAFRTVPRGGAKAVGGGVKVGLQAAGAAPGFTALFGGLILPAVSAFIGPPTNGAMQVASKMLHGRNGERSAAPLFGIKLEKKKDDSGKTKAIIYVDHDARKRNVGRLAKSSGRRFFSMAKKMRREYRRSFGDAYRAEKKAGMKGKWREWIFGSNVLPGGTLGDVVSLASDAIGGIASNAVGTFGNVATSLATGPGNVLTRKEVADRYKERVNKSKRIKASKKVAKQAPAATVNTPRDATVTAHPEHGLSPSPVRIVADRPISRPDHQELGARPSPAMRRLQAIAAASISDAAPTQRHVPAVYPNVPLAPPHLVSPSTEHVVESQTVIPRPAVQSASDPATNPSAVAATVASPSIVETGWRTPVDPQDRLPSNSSLGALPISTPREVPAQWIEPENQISASQPAASTVRSRHAFEVSVANGVEQAVTAPTATNNAELAQNNVAPAAVSAASQETARENRDAFPSPRALEARARAENKSDLNASVSNHGEESHAVDTTTSDTAGNDALPKLRPDERTGNSIARRPRCESQGRAHNGAPASVTSHTTVQSTPPNTPRGEHRIAMPVAAGISLSMN